MEESKLSIHAEKEDRAVILVASGRLDGTTVSILQSAVQEQIQAGETTLVFNLEGMSYVSSAGLRVFLMAARSTNAEGGKVLLFGLRDHIAEVFKISGLNNLLPIYKSHTEALAEV